MKPEMIILLPGILAWWTIVAQSAEAALMNVYLPVLLLIPDYFRLPINGLPDPTFGQTGILPIGAALFWRVVIKRDWVFSFLDFFVFVHLAWQVISDFYNVGFKDAQNLGFDVIALSVLPYMAGKALIEPAGLRVRFARRFVWLLFVVSLISVYEFKMGESLFRPLISPFFPDQDSEWVTQIRWGFGRIAGPYGHAILMGGILAMGYLMCRWLARSRQWETQFRWLGQVPFSKEQILTAGLLAAMLMTLSRGPWLGALCGLVLASIGANPDRRLALKRAGVILAIGGLLVFAAGHAYVSSTNESQNDVRKASEVAEEEQSAAYRTVLFDKYYDIAMERPIWGWGRANWPVVPGMASIDNNYLFIALNCGVVGVVSFGAMLLAAAWRLFAPGYFREDLDQSERAFNFTLIGVLAAIAISTFTVFLGSQLYPLLFLFLGWADGCVIEQTREPELVIFGFEPMRAIA